MSIKIRWYREKQGKHQFCVDGEEQALDDLWKWCDGNIKSEFSAVSNFKGSVPRLGPSPFGWWCIFTFDDSSAAQIFKLAWG